LKKLIVIFITVAGFLIIFWYTKKDPEIEVNDRIITKVAAGLELDSYSIFPPPKYVSIKGEILNKSNKPLSNVNLVYLIGDDTLNVMINYINENGKAFFTSEELKVNSASPDYLLLEINIID
jgi:hypothetical protein